MFEVTMLATSFPGHFVEQGFIWTVVLLSVPAIVFLSAVGASLRIFRKRLDARVVRAAVIATALALLISVVGIALFEALASWYRPYGDGVMRRTEGFREWAEIGFLGLYAGLVLLGVGCGWVMGHARAHRGRLVAVAVGIAIVGFLTATLPLVEYLNACHVGAPLLADRYIGCG